MILGWIGCLTLFLNGQTPIIIDSERNVIGAIHYPNTTIINPEFVTTYKIKHIESREENTPFSLNSIETTLPLSEVYNARIWDFNVHGQVARELLLFEGIMMEEPDTILSIVYEYDIYNKLKSLIEYREGTELRVREFQYKDSLLTKIVERDRNGYTGNDIQFYYDDSLQVKRKVEHIDHNKFQVEYYYPKEVDQEVIDFLVESELKQEKTEILIVYLTENDQVVTQYRFTGNGSYKDEFQYDEKGRLTQTSQLAYDMLVQRRYSYDTAGNLDMNWQSRTNAPHLKTDYVYDEKQVFLNEVIELEGEEEKSKTIFTYVF